MPEDQTGCECLSTVVGSTGVWGGATPQEVAPHHQEFVLSGQ